MAAVLRFVLVLIFALGLCCDAAWAADRRVTLPDGRHIFLNCTGQGSPTVILEGGFSADSNGWSKVQSLLAQSTRVCSYDRAGYGQSDPGPMPRDGRAVVKDLDQTLRQAGINGPFILVGHSLGALYMRLFADLRPADLAGMVLVDPSIEFQDKRFAAMFGQGAGSAAPFHDRAQRCVEAALKGALPSLNPLLSPCTEGQKGAPNSPANLANWRTQMSEADTMWGATSDEIDAGRYYYGDVPLIVLTADGSYATLPEPARSRVSNFWWKLHNEIAVRAMHGSNRLVAHSSHLMMLDRPDAIGDAVKEVLAKVRK